MRFDDRLKTILAADASSAFGAGVAFRQLVDLVARRRAPADAAIMGRLHLLRGTVPATLRASVARGLAGIDAPAPLIALFAGDDQPAVVAAVLREARLAADEWIDLLPGIGPAGRAILRGRRDLGAAVERALEAFGATDFVLSYDAPPPPAAFPVSPPFGESPFTPVGAVAKALPFVVEARRRAAEPAATEPANDAGGFRIADLVDRIAAFQRDRQAGDGAPAPAIPDGSFRFETDAQGVICWIDAAPRGAVVGISLAGPAAAAAGADGIAAGALARRTSFADARLTIGGASALAGEWRISGVPMFDPASGRFTGVRGAARRPRADESAAHPVRDTAASEGLRRLVHELRTPTTAIAGFSELIESELLGPVAPAYRARAATIRGLAGDLVAAIEDLDLAARIEGDALDLRPGSVAIAPILRRAIDDLAPLVRLRGARVAIAAADEAVAAGCDDRTVERLLVRLAATLVSATQRGERLDIALARDTIDTIGVTFTRPATLAAISDEQLLSLDAERETDLPGAPLLGIGFALRLARNLAAELGGSLVLAPLSLTVRLPAASIVDMGQASIV